MKSDMQPYKEIVNRWQRFPDLELVDSTTAVDLMANNSNHVFIGVGGVTKRNHFEMKSIALLYRATSMDWEILKEIARKPASAEP